MPQYSRDAVLGLFFFFFQGIFFFFFFFPKTNGLSVFTLMLPNCFLHWFVGFYTYAPHIIFFFFLRQMFRTGLSVFTPLPALENFFEDKYTTKVCRFLH